MTHWMVVDMGNDLVVYVFAFTCYGDRLPQECSRITRFDIFSP